MDARNTALLGMEWNGVRRQRSNTRCKALVKIRSSRIPLATSEHLRTQMLIADYFFLFGVEALYGFSYLSLLLVLLCEVLEGLASWES